MHHWIRFRQTIGQPAYRTKLVFFVILGFAAVLLAVLLRSHSPFWSEILLEFAVTFGAVGMLQFLWDFLGGEPLGLQIEEVKDEIRSTKSSITLLSDLIDSDIGIERIWPDRLTWQEDLDDGRKEWYSRMGKAQHIDMMSITLWHNWVHRNEFWEKLFEHADQEPTLVRILIYDPDSEVLNLRARDEERVTGKKNVSRRMQIEIADTLGKVREMGNRLSDTKKKLEVRLTTERLHPVQIIRADERMVIASYLSGETGGPSPTMQLRGSESVYFHKYAEQFNTIWQYAKPLDDTRLDQILKDYGHGPATSTEDKDPPSGAS